MTRLADNALVNAGGTSMTGSLACVAIIWIAPLLAWDCTLAHAAVQWLLLEWLVADGAPGDVAAERFHVGLIRFVVLGQVCKPSLRLCQFLLHRGPPKGCSTNEVHVAVLHGDTGVAA